MSAAVRAFIAVPIDEPLRGRVAALQRRLDTLGVRARWVEPENLHVTLLFLGDTDVEKIPEIGRAMGAVAVGVGRFGLEFRGIGAFPNLSRPKIVWSGIEDPTGSLTRLYHPLSRMLKDLGVYEPEGRGYVPHLTLGRLEPGVSHGALTGALAEEVARDVGPMTVEEIRLMASELTPRGPRYSTLSAASLAGE